MDDAAETFTTAVQHFQSSQLESAVDLCQQLLVREPAHADALHLLGAVALQRGNHKTALEYIRRAIQSDPKKAHYYSSLGIANYRLLRYDEAISSWQQALQVQPSLAEAHNNLGNAFQEQLKLSDAIASYQRAIEINPRYADAHLNLGSVRQKQGNLDEAVVCFQRALELRPEHAVTLNGLGSVLKDQGRIDEAITSFQKALEIKPDFAAAYSNILLSRQFQPGISIVALARNHSEWNRRYAATFKSAWKHFPPTFNSERSIRLGFVSADLGRHPVGYFLIKVLESLDTKNYQSICYSDRTQIDDLTDRFKASANAWRDIRNQSNEQLAEKIRGDQVDILFDLSGHTARNRLLAFARKPAPIQVTWAGYVGTTGLDAMDYLMADSHHVPGEFEPHYRESVIRLPHGYVCYGSAEDSPPVGPLPASQCGHVTFGSFNNPCKINPTVVAVWAEILKRVDHSRLVLKYRGFDDAGNQQRVARAFSEFGVAVDRIEMLGHSPHNQLMASYGQIDVALDPFPYSGGITTCEALWMCVPVITCPGETFASRHSLSHLSTVGLTEVVCGTHEQYVQCAVELASDLSRLAEIRSNLRKQMAASPLCDAESFTRAFESACRQMWIDACRARS